jgi:hypothetical protein
MALFAVIAILAIIGCKEDEPDPPPQPQPVEQDISLGNIKGYNVILHCWALPGVNPSYMTPLAGALNTVLSNGSGNRTVNVISGSNAGPSVVSNKLTIGESCFIGKDEEAIMLGIGVLNLGPWTS